MFGIVDRNIPVNFERSFNRIYYIRGYVRCEMAASNRVEWDVWGRNTFGSYILCRHEGP
jgi:hypothetical protein